MKVPFIDLKLHYDRIRKEILQVLKGVTKKYEFWQGPNIEAFENEFAAYINRKYCIAVSSGTAALHIAMRCLDIAENDEVITTPMSFISTAWCISYVGATPIFVDIDPVFRMLNPSQIENAISNRTKAIIPVHLFGMPANIDLISKIAEKYSLSVVEDCAQAIGVSNYGGKMGAIGKISCFSFFPFKNLGAFGEAGALLTDDLEIAERARTLRNHAQRIPRLHEEIGYNYRMDELQAAILRLNLKHIDLWNDERLSKAQMYTSKLSVLSEIRLPREPPNSKCTYHQYVIELENRDIIRQVLFQNGIETKLHYPVPIHLQPAYANLGIREGAYPIAECFANKCLSLPLFPELTEKQIVYVCDKLLNAIEKKVS